MYSTNNNQNILSYQSKTNNNRKKAYPFIADNLVNSSSNNQIRHIVNSHIFSIDKESLESISTSNASDISIDNPNNKMLTSVYRICVVCFLETIKLIKGTLNHIDGGKDKSPASASDYNDGASGIKNNLKREKSVGKKKYTSPSNNRAGTGNVYYVKAKVDTALLRKRADKGKQERPEVNKDDTLLRSEVKVNKDDTHRRNDNNGKSDLHKRVRCITYPASNGRTTTVKVVSASKTPQGCCLKTPSQNYSELLHSVSGNTKTFDQFMLRSSKNLGRGFKKHRSIPPPMMRTTRKSAVYRRRSLEVVMEEDEL